MTLRSLLLPLLAACLFACGSEESAGAGCEPGLLKCVGNDVAICTEDGGAFTLFKECGGGAACEAGICVGGAEAGDAGAGAGDGADEAGEGEAEGGDAGAGDGDGDAPAEQVAPGEEGEGEAEAPGEEGGEGESETGDQGDGNAAGGEGEEALNVPPDEAVGEGEGEGEGVEGVEGDEGAGEEGEGEPPNRCPPDPPCPGAMRCDPGTGQCLEPFVCEGPEDCVGDRFCYQGRCSEPCDDEDDCVGARSCDRQTGRCLEPALCIVPEDCDLGRVCVQGRCIVECDGDADCPGLQACDGPTRRCVEPDRCEEDVDCDGLRICQGQVCEEPCVDDDQCEGRQRCDAQVGRCVAPAVCLADIDCPGQTLCRAGGCLVPECERHDQCGGACVDARCAAGAPVECEADGDCDGALRCAAVDACGQVRPCEGPQDCSGAAPLCDRGACVDCVVDRDCAPSEVCEAGGCLLVLGCQDDRDCPGDRACEEQRCQPVACEGDRVDRGASSADVTAQAYTDLVLCDGTTDVYRFDLPGNQGLSAVLRHDGEAGDLSLAFEEEGPPPVPLARSDGRLSTERVGVNAALGRRVIRVVVRGSAGANVSYSLELRTHDAQWCAPDRHEGLAGNDSQGVGAPAGIGQYPLVICPGESDWFTVPAAAGTRLTVRATPTDGQGAARVRLGVYDEAGQLLGQGQPAGGAQVTQVDVAAGGRLGVRVRGLDDDDRVAVTLEIEAEAAPGAAGLACPGEAIGFDEPWALPVTLPVRRVQSSCAPVGGADHVASFELQSTAFVTARFEGPEPGSSLAILAECEAPQSELACGFDLRSGLNRVYLEAGSYTLMATGPPGVRAAVRLTKEDACRGDEECGGAQVCVGELCRAPCGGDLDCDGDQTCEQGSGHCVEPEICDNDRDCGGRRVCEHGQCLVPDCEAHTDCGDDAAPVCVDRLCVGNVPGACAGDGDCPGGLVCGEAEVCGQDGPCEGDGDCPGGAAVCEVDAGACVMCLGDQQCEAGEFCRTGECVYIGQCIGGGDEDCPGGRTCDDDTDRCVPAGGCRDDAIRNRARLTWRTYTGLVLCDDDTDRFSISVPPQRGATVAVRHPAGVGDLRLALRNPATGAVLATSDGPTGLELTGVAAAPLQRDLEIQITGRPRGVHVPYSLTLRTADADFCPPDALEGPGGNDTPDTATPTTPGAHELGLCPGESDHLTLPLSPGTRLTARLRPRGGDLAALTRQGITAEILAPDGQVLAAADAADPDALARDGALVVEADTTITGPHILRLVHTTPPPPAGEGLPLDLRLELGADASPDAAAVACTPQTADPITPGQPLDFERTVQVRRVGLSCGVGWGGDYIASFTLNAPATATVQLQGDFNATAISIAESCVPVNDAEGAEAAEAACGFAQGTPINGVQLGAGTWYILVESTDDPPAPILLTLN